MATVAIAELINLRILVFREVSGTDEFVKGIWQRFAKDLEANLAHPAVSRCRDKPLKKEGGGKEQDEDEADPHISAARQGQKIDKNDARQ